MSILWVEFFSTKRCTWACFLRRIFISWKSWEREGENFNNHDSHLSGRPSLTKNCVVRMRNTTTNLTHCSKSHILYYSSNICILLLSGIRSITFSIYVELIFFAYIECVKRYLKYQLLRSKARPQKQSFSSLICLMKICVRTSLMEERGCVCEHV